MQNLKIKLGIAVLIVFICGGLFIVFWLPQTAIYQTPPGNDNETLKEYSINDIRTHANAQNCWTTVKGNVYDLTPWINEHPGGTEAIISLCGIDATDAFTEQHGGQTAPEEELKSLFIGKFQP